MNHVAEIVAGLTTAQRECLSGVIAYRTYGVVVVQSGASSTLAALERRGILTGTCFTDLGLAVRAYLLSKKAS